MVVDNPRVPPPPPKTRRTNMRQTVVTMSKEEKEQLKKDVDSMFDQISKTFDDTFKKGDEIFKKSERIFESVERKMRDNEERLRKRMNDNTTRIMRKRSGVMKDLKNYDFTVSSDDAAKQLMKNMKIKSTIMGMVLIATLLFTYMMLTISTNIKKLTTTPQPLNPPALEETVTVDPERKL